MHKEGPDRLVLEAGASIDLPNSQITVVAPDGSDTTGTGSWLSPVATLTKAMSLASATRLAIYMLPGSYVEPAVVTWPNLNGLRVIGLGKLGMVTVSSPLSTTGVVNINPTYTAATFQLALENVLVSAIQANNGAILIDNAHMTKKLMLYLANVSTSPEVYGTIVMSHTTAGQAIRIYADGIDEIAGLFSLVAANTGDRCRIKNSALMGGLSSVGAIASEIYLQNTVILAGGLSAIDGANKFSHVGCVYRSNADPSVYTQLADAWATY
jgi:hypothetical protein